MSDYILKELPPDHDVETKSVLKQTLLAHRFLAELKGISKTIPNQNMVCTPKTGMTKYTGFRRITI